MTDPDPRTLPDADLLDRHERSIIEGDERAYLPLRAELLRRLAAAEATAHDRDNLLCVLAQIHETADDELRRLGAVPGSSVSQIEADARAALAASGITVGEQP